VALAFCLARSGAAAYGITAGIAALGSFAFNLLTPRLATLVRTDLPLALVLFLIGLAIWRKVQSGEPWQRCDRWWMFALLTAGMLIKGPIVYAFLLPGIICYQWWRRKTDAASAWFGWWPWLASLAIFLVWAVAGMRLVPGFYDQVVVREFLGRFGETVHRPQPIYFYLPHLLHKFAPWSIVLLLFAWLIYRRRQNTGASTLSPDIVWLAGWAMGGLIVMSCIPSKRVDRIFPVVPPLCLLLSAQIGRLRSNAEERRVARRWVVIALACAVLFSVGYSAYKIQTGYRGHRDALVEFGRVVRAEAQNHHWRYEAIAGSDEGMILYLDKAAFADPPNAVAAWNAGNLDAIVVPGDEVSNYERDLAPPVTVRLKSAARAELPGTYALLVHATE
jgi:4-amino-4-deoxy-L-arabinose transferase-like glycosyltransferase